MIITQKNIENQEKYLIPSMNKSTPKDNDALDYLINFSNNQNQFNYKISSQVAGSNNQLNYNI